MLLMLAVLRGGGSGASASPRTSVPARRVEIVMVILFGSRLGYFAVITKWARRFRDHASSLWAWSKGNSFP